MHLQPFALLLTGPSGCGKTSLRNTMLSRFPELVVASTDDLFVEAMGRTGKPYQEVYAELYEDVLERYTRALHTISQEGRSVILDRTHLRISQRAPVVALFRSAGYAVMASVPAFDVASPAGQRTLMARAAARTDRGAAMPTSVVLGHIQSYQPPTHAEGFTALLQSKA